MTGDLINLPEHVSLELCMVKNKWNQEIPAIRVFEYGSPRFVLDTPDMWKILEHIYNNEIKQ